MSRIGKLPIPIPSGVTVEQKERVVSVKGPKGTLDLALRPEIDVRVEANQIHVQPGAEAETREVRAYHGMTRSLLNNMVKGVAQGYVKNLEIVGVGWNATLKGKSLSLSVGYCNPVELPIPPGIQVETPKPTILTIRGADKQMVGQFTAAIRAVRPPEPYKGKGIRYEGEYVRKKQGKSFGS
jgi:large subunit ribosomal protein L6